MPTRSRSRSAPIPRPNGWPDFRIGCCGNLPAAVGRLREALSAERVDANSIPTALRDRWVAADGRAKVEIRARASIHEDRDALRRFVEAVRNEVPRAIGPPITVLEAGNTVVAAFLQATGTAILAIALLLAVTLRSLRSVAIGFLPLVLAASITMAAMVAAGLSFNHANVIVLPLLFGLGVANGIHLLARETAGRRGLARDPIQHTAGGAVQCPYHRGLFREPRHLTPSGHREHGALADNRADRPAGLQPYRAAGPDAGVADPPDLKRRVARPCPSSQASAPASVSSSGRSSSPRSAAVASPPGAAGRRAIRTPSSGALGARPVTREASSEPAAAA